MRLLRKIIDSLGQHRLLGGAFVLALTQAGASVLGLFRDNILAGTFPGLSTVDVYIASFRLSDLLFQMTIMAGFSVALVPLLARYRAEGNKREMSDLLSGVISVAALFFGAVALLCAWQFRAIAPLLTSFEGEAFELYVRFGQLALLTNFLFVFGNAFGQYLITIQRYWIYGITPLLYTAGTIAGTLFLTPYFGSFGPMLGTLGGAVAYVLVRLIGVMVAGYRPRRLWWHPDLSELGWLMLPRMLALGALQFELLFFDKVASSLDAGSVTINAYARNFQSVAVGIVGIALAQSAFSLLSQAAALKEYKRFWIYVSKGTAWTIALTVPSAIALALLAPVAAMLVNVEHVLALFRWTLLFYAISIPFESLNHLLLRSYYALKNTHVPALFNVLNGVIAVGFAWAFVGRFGVFALPIGFTLGQLLQATGLGVLLPWMVRRAARGLG